jgi:hypothetical protein
MVYSCEKCRGVRTNRLPILRPKVAQLAPTELCLLFQTQSPGAGVKEASGVVGSDQSLARSGTFSLPSMRQARAPRSSGPVSGSLPEAQCSRHP